MTGNDYGTEVTVGRYDACNGLFLKGDGSKFKPMSILQSGWFVPGNAKALVKLRRSDGSCVLIVSNNRSNLQAFRAKEAGKLVAVAANETNAMVKQDD